MSAQSELYRQKGRGTGRNTENMTHLRYPKK